VDKLDRSLVRYRTIPAAIVESISRLLAYANTTGETVWELAAAPEDVPGLGAAAIKALRRFTALYREG